VGDRNGGAEPLQGIHKRNPQVVAEVGAHGRGGGLFPQVHTQDFLEKILFRRAGAAVIFFVAAGGASQVGLHLFIGLHHPAELFGSLGIFGVEVGVVLLGQDPETAAHFRHLRLGLNP
jgi:hypothetical protein